MSQYSVCLKFTYETPLTSAQKDIVVFLSDPFLSTFKCTAVSITNLLKKIAA